jgi:tetratricopeptide (TPR) repeat protein
VLTDTDRKEIAAAAQTAVNVSVLRRLSRLVAQWKAEEHFRKRALKFIIPALLLVVVTTAGVFTWLHFDRKAQVAALAACEQGKQAARNRSPAQAIPLLSHCLTGRLPDDERATVLRVRAWSHGRLGQFAAALQDQEAAFERRSASDYRAFIDYAYYLRQAGRLQNSLDAIEAAERLESKPSMSTQYHKGWTLLELGRFGDAVDALSKGVPLQPDYPFVYWRRGLAYEGLGDKERAKKDFALCARLLLTRGVSPAAESVMPAIRQKLREYGLDKTYSL